MSEFLILSDLHIHPHKRSTDRLNDCIECLEWAFQTAIDRKVKTVLFLGDLFHDRQKIDVLTYQKTFEVFEKYLVGMGELWAGDGPQGYNETVLPPFEVYLLLGNHDLWHLKKWDVSSVNPLRAIPGVHVIDKTSTLLIEGVPISFLPYTHDPIGGVNYLLQDRKKHWPVDAKKILCGHVAIDGAAWNVMHGTKSEVSIEHDGDMVKVGPEIFKGWDQVFLGHYHAEQKLGNNCEYVGSPLQLSFGEAFQHKHILVLDTDTGDKEYIRNTFSPQHFIIPEKDLKKYDLKNNFIRVMVDDISTANVVEMRRDLLDNESVGSLEIKQVPPKVEDEKEELEVTKALLMQTDEMLKKYADSVDVDGLDKDKLLEIGKDICESGISS